MKLRLRVVTTGCFLILAGCVQTGLLQQVPQSVQSEQAARPAFSCVDTLVVSNAGFEPKKIFGFIPPPQSTAQTWGMTTKATSMMDDLAVELRFRMGEAGNPGIVSTTGKGYRPSPCRTHLVTIAPTGASQGAGLPTVTVQVTVFELKDKRQIWQSSATLVEGRPTATLSQSVLSSLQSLGMRTNPKAPVSVVIPGLPVELGQSVAAVQAALNTQVEPKEVQSPIPGRRTKLSFADRGIELYFDKEDKLERISLKSPYSESVQSIRVGTSKSVVLRMRGEATRELDRTSMHPALLYRTSNEVIRYEFDKNDLVSEIWIGK